MTIRSGVIVVGSDVLEAFNHDQIEINHKELVYLMLETKNMYVNSWLKLYQTEPNLDSFIQQKVLKKKHLTIQLAL